MVNNAHALTEAELDARLRHIQPVSWQWNAKGLLHNVLAGNIFKSWNRREQGVLSQNVRDELADSYPEIVEQRHGILRVDYGTLANLLWTNLHYLDETYQAGLGTKPPLLRLQSVLDAAVDTEDPQNSVVRLLLASRRYWDALDTRNLND